MGDPAVLILDEPANGMDPEGIRWMRLLLTDFAGRGGTVLLSSHLLAEVQATVDRLVVIGSGRIVAEDSLASLLAGQGTTVRGLDQPRSTPPFAGPASRRESVPTARCACRPPPSKSAVWPASTNQVLLELREGEASGLEELFFATHLVPTARRPPPPEPIHTERKRDP